MRAFRRLYAEHYGFVWAIAQRMGVRPDLVDDVVQDAFLTAYRRLGDLPDERSRAWLYGITRRVSSNYRRAERRRTRKHDALAVARPRAVEVEGQLAAGRALDRFLDGLEERDRELFVLGEIEGLTGAELATALQARPSTLYGRLQVLRQRFRQDVGTPETEVLRARVAARPRASAAKWGLLHPLLGSPVLPAAAVPGLAMGVGGVKLGLGALAAVVVVGATSVVWNPSPFDVSGGDMQGTAASDEPAPARGPSVAPSAASLARGEPLPKPIGNPVTAVQARSQARSTEGAEPGRSIAVAKDNAAAHRQTPDPAPKSGADPAGLAAEAALIRGASAALADDDPRTALALMGEHGTRFPQGALTDAAGALRIEALCADGQALQARTEADALLQASPSSPVAGRVRRACRREKKEQATP